MIKMSWKSTWCDCVCLPGGFVGLKEYKEQGKCYHASNSDHNTLSIICQTQDRACHISYKMLYLFHYIHNLAFLIILQ